MARTQGRPDTTRKVGLRVERRVLRYLERRGLTHVESNVGTRHGELDIVMLDGGCLVFVEVRYRGPGSRVSAVESVDRHKQRRILSAAATYLARHPEHYDRACRFDVVGIDRNLMGRLRLDWIRDAFRAC